GALLCFRPGSRPDLLTFDHFRDQLQPTRTPTTTAAGTENGADRNDSARRSPPAGLSVVQPRYDG
ncbi:hypothetical protein, partial [Arthrobacter sp. 35/47]|uniref:hypothetical protein n=1 Tax=Arthrobacter sp. 35/47 TaxID=269454 RepID=UPI001C1E2AF2